MGMFDEVWLPCPKCGHKHYEQSKGGKCNMQEFHNIEETPAYILGYLTWDDDIFECDNCGIKFVLKYKFWTEPSETNT